MIRHGKGGFLIVGAMSGLCVLGAMTTPGAAATRPYWRTFDLTCATPDHCENKSAKVPTGSTVNYDFISCRVQNNSANNPGPDISDAFVGVLPGANFHFFLMEKHRGTATGITVWFGSQSLPITATAGRQVLTQIDLDNVKAGSFTFGSCSMSGQITVP